MKDTILSIILLALIISLTITVGSANLTTALAIENYLQLRSASVNYQGGDIDVNIKTGGSIPSENGNNGFGYAVLTDVGDESVDNVLVAISDIGIKNNDKSTKNDKLYTYVLDLTGDISRDCSGSDYEVARSSSDNEAFETDYPINVKGNKISIDDIDTNDLASDTVKAVASFTAEAITNNGKIKQICIDIQDVLKQSEISIDYNNNNDNDEDSKKDDNDNDDEDSLFEADIDQFIDQSNTCGDEADCDNEGDNEVNLWEDISSDSDIDISQSIEQSNECDDEANCSNEGNNEANVFGTSDVDISQSIEQSSTCSGSATCSNFASNIAIVG